MTLHYEFPADITLNEVVDLIKDNKSFIMADKGDYVVFNYIFAGNEAHPPVVDRKTAILRELRGLIFSKETGKVISRRYHKFFNLHERPDINIDINKEHIILEKADGSMITPLISNNKLIWGSKMGETFLSPKIEKFLENKPQYRNFALLCINENKTPIFEWVSRDQKIVIDYEEENLILVAIRNNDSGLYLPYSSMMVNTMRHSIPYIKTYDTKRLYKDNINSFVDEIRDMVDGEGIVIHFNDGHMIKIKSSWYVTLHRAKSLIENERDVLKTVLDGKVDDLYPLLDAPYRERLIKYTTLVWQEIYDFQARVNILLENTKHMSRKEFAFHTTNENKMIRSMGFSHFESKIITLSNIIEIMKKYTGSNSHFESKILDIINVRWKEVKLDEYT